MGLDVPASLDRATRSIGTIIKPRTRLVGTPSPYLNPTSVRFDRFDQVCSLL